MGKLIDIYSNIENPLDNKKTLKQIVAAYSKSIRSDFIGATDLYNSIVTMNQTIDNSNININDKESFYVNSYNQWIENIINLDENQIRYLKKSRGMDGKELQQYLKSFGKITSMRDIQDLKSNPLFEKEVNGWELLHGGWDHIKSEYLSVKTEDSIPVKHRLYVGCQNQDLWKLSQLFKNKCDEQQIPFYFKSAPTKDRDDKIVIYADTDNLGNYVDFLQEIAKENPEIVQRCGNPPVMTGKIDGWIGIGDEPPKKENGESQSYNMLRSEIFEDAIEETLLSDIAAFKGKDVSFKGKQIKFNELFLKQSTLTIINRLDRDSNKIADYGLKTEDLSNPKFKGHIKTHLKTSIQKGLNKLEEVKDTKSKLHSSNNNAIFSIPTRQDKSVPINTYDMDAIIKSMIPIMQEVDSNFMEKIKNNIQEKCRQNGIDDTFCFQQCTKELFEKVDANQSINIDRKRKAFSGPKQEQEMGISQTAEKRKILEENNLRIKNEKINNRNVKQQDETQNVNSAKKETLDFTSITDAVKKSKITMFETKVATKRMLDMQEIQRLLFKEKIEQLTQEEQSKVDEYKRQRKQLKHAKQQHKKQSNGLEL